MTETAVHLRDLTFRYRCGDAAAVEGLTLAVAAHEVVGLLGPSGAGKTTTQRILIGLLRGYEGEVRVLGRDRSAWGPEFFEHVGVSPELPAHYRKLTARENLDLFASLYRGPTADPAALLERVGLAESADQRVGTFSKGMQMRLNLVRAVLHQPRLLFLDEPTSGMDPGIARVVVDLIREQRDRGCAVLLTTHDLHLADGLCDRVAFLVGGRLAGEGAPAELRRAHGSRQVRVHHRGRETVFALDGLADDPAFLRVLGDGVTSIHSIEPTLEQVFLALSGAGGQ